MGKLNFLENSTRPDIAYATYQCAHFSQDPRASHSDAKIHLVKYLKATRTQRITLDTNRNKIFEVYAGANFVGNWHHPIADDNPSTAKSRTSYSIMYSVCPIIWCINMQTQITLSTMEVDYIALFQSLWDTIIIMQLLKEIKCNGFHTLSSIPQVTLQIIQG